MWEPGGSSVGSRLSHPDGSCSIPAVGNLAFPGFSKDLSNIVEHLGQIDKCVRLFSCISLRTNAMSVLLRLALKSHWLSGCWASAIRDTTLFNSNLAKLLSAIKSRISTVV